MVTLETPIEELIDLYTKDILYNCHSIELKISRSEARVYLQELGKESLKVIALEMQSLFINASINYDLFMAYVILICGIIQDHNLPEGPYGSNVEYGNQDPKAWIEYCQKNG